MHDLQRYTLFCFRQGLRQVNFSFLHEFPSLQIRRYGMQRGKFHVYVRQGHMSYIAGQFLGFLQCHVDIGADVFLAQHFAEPIVFQNFIYLRSYT